MYNNNNNMYNSYYPYLNNMALNNASFPNQKQEIVRVNGKNGADAYQMAPNSSILLLDETAPIIWLKTTDGASYPTVTGYTITPIETKIAPPIEDKNYAELESRIAKLEEVINNGKSDVRSVKQVTKQ